MNKLKEIFMYFLAFALFAAAAYNLGWFNNLNAGNIKDAYQTASDDITNAGQNYDNSNRTQKIGSHKPIKIPDQVIQGSITSKSWLKVFTSDKKVVFCVYDNDKPAFRDALLNFVHSNKLDRYYDVIAYNENSYKRNNAGAPETRICTTIADCKKMREKAANYALLTNFMDKCSKTVCIFNPAQRQYIMLKKRKFSELKQLLIDIRSW